MKKLLLITVSILICLIVVILCFDSIQQIPKLFYVIPISLGIAIGLSADNLINQNKK